MEFPLEVIIIRTTADKGKSHSCITTIQVIITHS